MSRDSRREGNLFVGRLNRNTRIKDLEEVFEAYGRIVRCDIKYGKSVYFRNSLLEGVYEYHTGCNIDSGGLEFAAG